MKVFILLISAAASIFAMETEVLKPTKNDKGEIVEYTVHVIRDGKICGGKVFDGKTGVLKWYDVIEFNKDGKIIETKIYHPGGILVGKIIMVYEKSGDLLKEYVLLPDNTVTTQEEMNKVLNK